MDDTGNKIVMEAANFTIEYTDFINGREVRKRITGLHRPVWRQCEQLLRREAEVTRRQRLVRIRHLINQQLRLEDLAIEDQTQERQDECRQGYKRMVAEIYGLLGEGDER